MLSQRTLGFFRMPPGPNLPGAAGTSEGGREATSLGSIRRPNSLQYYVPGDLAEIQARDVSQSYFKVSKLCSVKSPERQVTSSCGYGLVEKRFCKGDLMRTGQRELGGPVPGVFLEAFQCAQEKREGKAHPRSVSSKQNVGGPQVQNGPHFQDSPVYQGGSLGNSRTLIFT